MSPPTAHGQHAIASSSMLSHTCAETKHVDGSVVKEVKIAKPTIIETPPSSEPIQATLLEAKNRAADQGYHIGFIDGRLEGYQDGHDMATSDSADREMRLRMRITILKDKLSAAEEKARVVSYVKYEEAAMERTVAQASQEVQDAYEEAKKMLEVVENMALREEYVRDMRAERDSRGW